MDSQYKSLAQRIMEPTIIDVKKPYQQFQYPTRVPYNTELNYFSNNPNVGGMATLDNYVIINPYSQLNDSQKKAIKQNESARLYLRQYGNNYPRFDLTPSQNNYFNNNLHYSTSPTDIRDTILGRLLSGDNSAQLPTAKQWGVANKLRNDMQNMNISTRYY